MLPALDIVSLRWFTFFLVTIIFVILLIFRFKNSDLPGLKAWYLYPLLISSEALLSLFPELRTHSIVVHLGNGLTILAYFALTVGVAKFCHIKINNKLIFLSLLAFVILSILTYYGLLSRETRLWASISFVTLALCVSIGILTVTKKQMLGVERYFVLSWLLVHLITFIARIYLALGTSSDFGQSLSSWVYLFMNVSHIMIMIGLMLLILERRRVQLRLALKSVESNSRLKSQFLSTMSHELRTPLNSIIGFSETLQHGAFGELSAKQGEYVNYIKLGGELLLKHINEILILSQIEGQRGEVLLKNIDVVELVTGIIPLMTSIAVKKNIQINFEEPTIPNPLILADHIKMQQILINIISNAVKFGKPDGHVWIKIETHKNNAIKIIVRDDGLGIEESEAQNVYKRFNRAGRENSGIEGTGAGLAITRSLVTQMNGEIDFQSECGTGSTFWVILPSP